MTKARKIIILAAAILIVISFAWNSIPGGPGHWIMWDSFGIQAAVILAVSGAAFIIAKKKGSGGKS